MRFLLSCVLLFLVACAPRLDVGAPCDLMTDCPAPLVCRHERCRTACRESRDCPIGLRCVIDGNGGSACTLETEEACDVARPCPLGLTCDRTGECRSRCTNDSDCTESGRCEGISCVEPNAGEEDAGVPNDSTCTPSAMVCGNDDIDRCDLDFPEIAGVMTGATTGELDVLAVYALPPEPWPVDAGSPLPPEIALGISRLGFGIVGHIGRGVRREVLTSSFLLSDVGTARPIPAGPAGAPITDAISLALSEDGDQVTGFVLLKDPMPSATSGFRLTFTSDLSTTAASISAGTMPPQTAGHLAIIGGESSVRSTDEPIWYLTREVFTDDTHVVGAIDEMRGMSTYRATLTAPLGGSPTLESSGSAGRLALFRDSGPMVGLWDVERTRPLDELLRMVPGDLSVHNVGAEGAPAIAQRAMSPFYLLAVPVVIPDAGGTPVGYTRFYDVECPAVSPCRDPRNRGRDLQSRNGRVPAAVRLAGLPGDAHALAVLEPIAGGETSVRLRFLDSNLTQMTNELIGSIVPSTPNPAAEDIVAIEVRAVTDGSVVSVIVAALVRDYVLQQDHIVLAGVRACVIR